MKLRDIGRNQCKGEILPGRETNCSSCALVVPEGFALNGQYRVFDFLCLEQDRLATLGQRVAILPSIKKSSAQFVLKRRNATTDRWWAGFQNPRGLGEAARPRHRQE